MAKDKHPNLTLAIATAAVCDYAGCDSHGVVSKSVEGNIVRRCLTHLISSKDNSDEYMLKFLGLI